MFDLTLELSPLNVCLAWAALYFVISVCLGISGFCVSTGTRVTTQKLKACQTKKTWGMCGALQDHLRIMQAIPYIFKAPFTLSPKEGESLMLALNSANSCPYCTELHGELGRMAGLEDANAINTMDKDTNTDRECQLFVHYGRVFGDFDGRGAEVDAAYQSLETTVGSSNAKCAQALGYFLFWGSMSGNTLNAFWKGTLRCAHKDGSNVLFELLFFVYYCVLFTLIVVVSFVLKAFPSKVPTWLSSILGVILAAVASIWIVPFGVFGLLTAPLRCGEVVPTIPGMKANCGANSTPAAAAPVSANANGSML
jgi:AhpD family alkylhydroperoxidase